MVKTLPTEVISVLTFIVVAALAWERIAPWLGMKRADEKVNMQSYVSDERLDKKTIAEIQENAREHNGILTSLTNEIQALISEVRELKVVIKTNKELADKDYEHILQRVTYLEKVH